MMSHPVFLNSKCSKSWHLHESGILHSGIIFFSSGQHDWQQGNQEVTDFGYFNTHSVLVGSALLLTPLEPQRVQACHVCDQQWM